MSELTPVARRRPTGRLAGSPRLDTSLAETRLKRLAAIDLGSNSFRLEVGQVVQGRFLRTSYIKEPVRQGGGLDENRCLTEAAMQSGLDCLARFAESIRDLRPGEVRAVATQTLREARNRDVFLKRARQVLGFPIEVISGKEEARLIYAGVTSKLPASDVRRLVVDIGGRSTELIVGTNRTPEHMDSYRVGSVAWSRRFFADGLFTAGAFEIAKIAATAVLDEAVETLGHQGWEVAYGSAGTIGAIGEALEYAGWPHGVITTEGLDWMVQSMVRAGHAESLSLPGIGEDRKPVIGGGVSILWALFDLLGIDEMQVAEGGLRHGLIQEMIGGSRHLDPRDGSVDALLASFAVDRAQSERVARVATFLFDQAASHFPECQDRPQLRKTLQWAARLHEVGNLVGHSDYHKHGAYILDNSDAPGFTLSEMHRLSLLVLGQKGKLRKLGDALEDPGLTFQLFCLRLAVLLCHARRTPDIDNLHLARRTPDTHAMVLKCHADWAGKHPQSIHMLREESLSWAKTPWSLEPQVLAA